MTVRTRFAPSPTGLLHIGSARTALFCLLYAHHCQGEFILRIEDTDRERSTEASVDAIIDGLRWLGLRYDKGPYYQTQHLLRYKEVAEQLLASGHAYRCYCTKERLVRLREEQIRTKRKPRYDGHCRDLTEQPTTNNPHVLRFRNPQQGTVCFDDLVRGPITVRNAELDDLVIMRGDDMPTYNFAVVVDDWDMQITHVVRGDDHINNTPRQINIFKALNAPVPSFAHVPMILDAEGSKLSKRTGAASVLAYRDEGLLPIAVLNYLVRLGWSRGDQEIFSLEEMVQHFELSAINNAPAALNPAKLLWLNQHYLKTLPVAEIYQHARWYLDHYQLAVEQGPDFLEVIKVQRERVKTLVALVQESRFFYEEIAQYEEHAAKKSFSAAALEPLELVYDNLAQTENWTVAAVHAVVLEVADLLELKLGKVAQPLRVALTGAAASPSIDVILVLLGKARSLARIERAIAYIKVSS